MKCVWEKGDDGKPKREWRDVPSSYHDIGYRCVVCGVSQCSSCVDSGDEQECLGQPEAAAS